MSSVNKVIIVGNLGRDPESRSFQNGGKIVNLRIATSERWKDRSTGEQKERTEWHSVVIMNEGLCGFAEKYLRKGSKVYVEGKLQTRKWQDQAGTDRYSTEVVLGPFNSILTLLDKAQGDPGRHDYSGHADGPGMDRGSSGSGFGGGGFAGDDLDDDVPF